jgi:16S rRNA (cytosine967-C5)-methyltransferase
VKTASVSPARACAYGVIRRVFEDGAYADRALHAAAAGLPARERALATQLAYGTVQRRGTLDHVIAALTTRPLERLDPPVLAALRLGMFQILFLAVADHAAVYETVELSKRAHRGGAGLVNAVLRRGIENGPAILRSLDDADAAGAAIMHSVPQWLAELWWRELGAQEARALLARVNQPAESVLRENGLTDGATSLLDQLPAHTRPASGPSEAIVLAEPFDAYGSELWRRGAIMPQSRGSMLVSRVLAPQPGERVLDLCAAPGAKTTHLAALMADQGEIVAVERHRGRADGLRRTCGRMHASCVRIELGDASAPRSAAEPKFDRVLVDPPCSGLGTLQSRPDLRWHARPEAIAELAQLQAQILRAGAASTAPGGALVYSVCTISRAEGPELIEAFLGEHPQFRAEQLSVGFPDWSPLSGTPHLQLLPHRDGTDGFFIARLRRA